MTSAALQKEMNDLRSIVSDIFQSTYGQHDQMYYLENNFRSLSTPGTPVFLDVQKGIDTIKSLLSKMDLSQDAGSHASDLMILTKIEEIFYKLENSF